MYFCSGREVAIDFPREVDSEVMERGVRQDWPGLHDDYPLHLQLFTFLTAAAMWRRTIYLSAIVWDDIYWCSRRKCLPEWSLWTESRTRKLTDKYLYKQSLTEDLFKCSEQVLYKVIKKTSTLPISVYIYIPHLGHLFLTVPEITNLQIFKIRGIAWHQRFGTWEASDKTNNWWRNFLPKSNLSNELIFSHSIYR